MEELVATQLLLHGGGLRPPGRAPARAADTTLNVVTAGDQNMVDYVNNYPGAEVRGAASRACKVRAVGTGPGRRRSQKIYEKLDGAAEGRKRRRGTSTSP